MEQELTMEELIALINSQKGDFVIRVEFGEEAVSDAKEESVIRHQRERHQVIRSGKKRKDCSYSLSFIMCGWRYSRQRETSRQY